MRYLSVPTYQFTDSTGRTVVVKEMRDLTQNNLAPSFTMNKQIDDDIDEIASRQYVYGDGGERDSWKLHEANIVQILDAEMDYSKILSLVVPI